MNLTEEERARMAEAGRASAGKMRALMESSDPQVQERMRAHKAKIDAVVAVQMATAVSKMEGQVEQCLSVKRKEKSNDEVWCFRGLEIGNQFEQIALRRIVVQRISDTLARGTRTVRLPVDGGSEVYLKVQDGDNVYIAGVFVEKGKRLSYRSLLKLAIEEIVRSKETNGSEK